MSNSRSRLAANKHTRHRKRRKIIGVLSTIIIGCAVVIAAGFWISKLDLNPFVYFGNDSQQSANSHPSSSQGESSPQSEDEGSPAANVDGGDEGQASDEPVSGAVEQTDKVKLALVGDILPAANVLNLMVANGYEYPFIYVKDRLQAADIAAANLETPITDRGTPATRGEPPQLKDYFYRAPPDVVSIIQDSGFDFLSLANNHTLDYGWEGLSDTMEYLDEAGLKYAGAGMDDKAAYSPRYMEVGDFTIAFVSLSRVIWDVNWKADRTNPGVAETYTIDRAVEAVKTAKSNADLVVVMVHWGIERQDTPDESQKYLAYSYIDAGADLVIGSHPHVLQGFESYKGKWIAYSLGNFVFPGMSPPTTAETGILSAVCSKDGNCDLSFEPMIAKLAQPKPMDEESGKALLARLSSLSINAEIKSDGKLVAKSN
ncbi:MAG: CapA family protein [Candidatus Cohnella colombiensis]|uniref:CapA family protein n=1 Tax=Candidatus Cohnella colombiensis TaxID=3121368 RepID=A0AA95JBS0_9BACL|nr:MAG: CapA family protein [Cohnella sp.]